MIAQSVDRIRRSPPPDNVGDFSDKQIVRLRTTDKGSFTSKESSNDMSKTTAPSGADASSKQDVRISARPRTQIPFVQVPTWIISAGVDPGAVMLYITLLDYARGSGEAFPKRKTLADRMGVSVQTVSNRTNALVEAGLLEVVHQYKVQGEGTIREEYVEGARQIESLYIIETVNPREGQADSTQGGQVELTQGGQAGLIPPHQADFIPRRRSMMKKTHGEEDTPPPLASDPAQDALDIPAEPAPPAGGGSKPKRKREEYPPEFAAFWEVYPKKADKRAALKAWRAAKKRTVVADSELLGAAMKYRDDPNREDQFTKNPATWLNKGSWENGPLPARNGNNRAQERLKNNLGVVEYFAEQEQATGNYWGELER